MLDLTIGVVTHNSKDVIGRLLTSIYKYTEGISFQVYMVDNASSDGTVAFVREQFPQVEIVETQNNGFGWGHNKLLHVESRYHAIVNPDIVLHDNACKTLVDFMDKTPECVLVTPRVLDAEGNTQHLPKRKPTFRYMFWGRLSRFLPMFRKVREEYTMQNQNFEEPTEIEFCTGCFMLFRTEVFKKLKGFDEQFFMYLEDADITDRAKEYGSVVFHPKVTIVHDWEGGSAKNFKLLKIHLSSMCKYFKKQKEQKEK